MYSGIAVSSGVAIGKAYLLDRSKVCVIKRSVPEKEIENEIKRLRDAIESISEGFALFDADDRMVLCNDKFRQFAGPVMDKLEPGTTMEDIVRAGVETGYLDYRGLSSKDQVKGRMTAHLTPAGRSRCN